MKRIVFAIFTFVMIALLTSTAEAQWMYRRSYRPVVVAPQPMMPVYRRPTVVYQPTSVVYSRRRPILGGYSVRTRPAYRRTVVW
jgi:hypothetical protein